MRLEAEDTVRPGFSGTAVLDAELVAIRSMRRRAGGSGSRSPKPRRPSKRQRKWISRLRYAPLEAPLEGTLKWT